MVGVEATGQIYKQVQSYTYPEGAVTETPDMSVESPGGPAHAGCASGGAYVSSTTNQK